MIGRFIVLALAAVLLLGACGRKGEVEPPAGARADAPRVPQRGSPVLYPF
jgi:predicted small lipoprotein YifL